MKKYFIALFALLFLHSSAVAADIYTPQQLKFQKDITTKGALFRPYDFYKAVQGGNYDLAETFLKAGIRPDAKYMEMTPLSAAIAMKDIKMTQLLLDGGANPNTAFIPNWTPLNFAIWHNDTDIALLLLEKGADPSVKNTGGYPLDVAVTREDVSVIKALYAKKPVFSNIALYNGLSSKNAEIQTVFAQDFKIEDLEHAKMTETVEWVIEK